MGKREPLLQYYNQQGPKMRIKVARLSFPEWGSVLVLVLVLMLVVVGGQAQAFRLPPRLCHLQHLLLLPWARRPPQPHLPLLIQSTLCAMPLPFTRRLRFCIGRVAVIMLYACLITA